MIMAHQCGFTNAVAVLGTALGAPQIPLAECGVPTDVRIVLVLDGDEAGRKRANEVLELFVAENADVRVLTLPGEADPCEFLLAEGPAGFRAADRTARRCLQHAMAEPQRASTSCATCIAPAEALEQAVANNRQSAAPRGRNGHSGDEEVHARPAGWRVSSAGSKFA